MEPLDFSELGPGEGTFSSYNYKESVRGRASDSLKEVKHAFSTPFPGPSSLKPPLSASPRYDMSPRTSQTRFKQTRQDEHHNSAVKRLKAMLQQQLALEQNQDALRHTALSAQMPVTRSRFDIGKFTDPALSGGVRIKTQEAEPQLEDALPFMSSQSSYIQQLEGENAFCKDELASLRSKTQSVIDDNVRLYEELKTSMVHLAQDQGQMEQDNKYGESGTVVTAGGSSATSQVKPETQMDKNSYSRWAQELEQMKSLHEAKTNRLEAQLAYTRSELEKYEKQYDELRSKLRMCESVNLLARDENRLENGVCVRCAQHEAVIASTRGSAHVKALERVTNERDELMDTLTRLRSSMNDLKQRESNAYNQVKQSVTLVEQAQLEKTALLVHREQLKEDQLHLQQRMEEMIQEHQQRLAQERQLTRKECQHETAQLNQKIGKLTDDLGSAHNQLDRVTREKVAITSELEQSKSQIMQHSHQVSQVSEGVHMTTATTKVQRDDAIRQLERLRQSTQQEIRDKELENDRLRKELSDIRRRLEASEKQSTSSREECIKLTQELNLAEREVSQAKLAKDTAERKKVGDVKTVTRRAQQREMELQQTLHEVESKYFSTVAEIEDLAANQSSLINKLRAEGRTLTEQLDQVSNKYRTEVRRLKQGNAELSSRSERLACQHAEMETQCIDHGDMHHKMTARLHQMEEHAQRSAQQIYELLEKQTSLMQERAMLSKENDFLHSQLKNSASFNTRQQATELDMTPELDVNVVKHDVHGHSSNNG